MAGYKRKTLRWLAPVAMVGAVGLAACGDDGASESVQTRGAAAPAVIGSDRHLDNLADELALRESAVVGSDVHLTNRAAEIAEQQARADQAADTGTTDDEFVPGTRRMPMR